MAAREETKEDNNSGRGISHYDVDGISYHSNNDNYPENMGSLQHITDFEGKSGDILE